MDVARKVAAPAGAGPLHDGRDFYRIADVLDAGECAIVDRVRLFMENEVAPIINDYWAKAKFPFELVPKLRELGIAGTAFEGFGCPGGTNVLNGFICMEMARVDPSIATFFGLHSGLGCAQRPGVCTAAWRWARSTFADPMSNADVGCRRWPGWTKSAPSG